MNNGSRILGRIRRRPIELENAAIGAKQASLADGYRPRTGGTVQASDAFTPRRPKPGHRPMVGRAIELARILQALREEKAHVILYAERGRGKTSLANVVVEHLRQSDIIVARYSCEASSTFDSVMRGLARDLPATLLAQPGEAGSGCESALPQADLRPSDVIALLRQLTYGRLVCLVDEFDRIEDKPTQVRFADTIKQVSDLGLDLCFMIVSASGSLEQVIGPHPSIERNVASIHLPLMTDDEIATVLRKGSMEAGYPICGPVLEQATKLCRGVPHTAEMLGLRLMQATSASVEGSTPQQVFRVALDRLIEETMPAVAALYGELTDNRHDRVMAGILEQIASLQSDSFGRLTARKTDLGMVVCGITIPDPVWQRLMAVGVLKIDEGDFGKLAIGNRNLISFVGLLGYRSRMEMGDNTLAHELETGAVVAS